MHTLDPMDFWGFAVRSSAKRQAIENACAGLGDESLRKWLISVPSAGGLVIRSQPLIPAGVETPHLLWPKSENVGVFNLTNFDLAHPNAPHKIFTVETVVWNFPNFCAFSFRKLLRLALACPASRTVNPGIKNGDGPTRRSSKDLKNLKHSSGGCPVEALSLVRSGG